MSALGLFLVLLGGLPLLYGLVLLGRKRRRQRRAAEAQHEHSVFTIARRIAANNRSGGRSPILTGALFAHLIHPNGRHDMTRPPSGRYLGSQQDGEDQLVRYHLYRSGTSYLYNQMVDHLTERIASGELALHDPLPAEVKLAREYGVSLGTARRATEVLRERGLVATLRSKGTFVVAGRPTESTDDEPEPGWLAFVQEVAR